MTRPLRSSALTLPLIALACLLTACGGGGGSSGGPGPGRHLQAPALVAPNDTGMLLTAGDRFVMETDLQGQQSLLDQFWAQLTSFNAWRSGSLYYNFYTCGPGTLYPGQPCFTYGGINEVNGSIGLVAIGHYHAPDGTGPYFATVVDLNGERRLIGFQSLTTVGISFHDSAGTPHVTPYHAE